MAFTILSVLCDLSNSYRFIATQFFNLAAFYSKLPQMLCKVPNEMRFWSEFDKGKDHK